MKNYFYGLAVIIIILFIVILFVLPKPELEEKYILISLHDVTPFYDKEVNLFLEELEKREIHQFTILITPNWDKEYPLTKYPQFVKKISYFKENGAELALHGYDHKGFNLKKEEAEIKLQKSLDLYVSVFGNKPTCFVPPVYKQSADAYLLLKEKNFSCTESLHKLEYFSGNTYRSFPLGMESLVNNKYLKYDFITPFITKTFSKIYANLIWNHGGVVRYSLHPREVEIGNFNATFELLDGFLEHGWKPITYSELETK